MRMNQLRSGANNVMVLVDSLSLQVADGVVLRSVTAFPLCVSLDYYPYIRGDNWEEPDEPEHAELISAHLLGYLYLTNNKGVTCTLDTSVNVLELLEDVRYDRLATAVTQNSSCYGFDGSRVTL